MEDFRKGLLLTLVLGCAILFLFFGPLLKDINQVYFSPSGDGLKSYASSVYHLQTDTSIFHSYVQNYPYGEMVFFTDCQPMIVNPVKILANIGIDFRPWIVAILNSFMLISIVLAAVFIFLIFHELKVKWWFAAIASVGIAMLSPQVGRLGGHFALSHLMWLPMLIWMLMKFDQKRTYWLSAIIGFVTFFAAGMQMYFFALFGFLFMFYWGYVFLSHQMKITEYKWLIHLFLQLILPLILVQLISNYSNTVTDRTTHPWGLFTFRAYPATIFLPLHKPYSEFLKTIGVKHDYEWEAFAFIGMVALSGVCVGIYQMVQRIKQKKLWWKFSDNLLLTSFIWASIASLLLSFSIPFNLGLTFLLDYLGPIQQLRALSRFSWLFFYIINIMVFYGISQLLVKGARFKILTIFALGFLIYDGYLNVKVYAPRLNNRVEELDDAANSMPENAWISAVNVSDYQAVLPLPYFHVGSENVWLDSKCESLRQSLIVSLKSGLPSMGVFLSRTSISQTYKSLELAAEPVVPYRITNELPNRKPLLLMVDNCNTLTTPEKNLFQNAQPVWQGPKFSFYRLEINQLDSIAKMGEKQFNNEMAAIYSGQADTSKVLWFNGFEDSPQPEAFAGNGALQGNLGIWMRIVEKQVSGGTPGDTCEILFWVKGYETDLFARTNIEFIQKDGEQTTGYIYDQFQHFYCSLKNDWMRIKIPFVMKTGNDLVMVTVRNKDLKKFTLIVDDLIIRKKMN